MSDADTQAGEWGAVIDRFEGDTAVLLVGADQQVVDVPRDLLPASAQPGQWLRLAMHGGVIRQVTCDQAATDAAHQRIAAKLARLRRGDHLRDP